MTEHVHQGKLFRRWGLGYRAPFASILGVPSEPHKTIHCLCIRTVIHGQIVPSTAKTKSCSLSRLNDRINSWALKIMLGVISFFVYREQVLGLKAGFDFDFAWKIPCSVVAIPYSVWIFWEANVHPLPRFRKTGIKTEFTINGIYLATGILTLGHQKFDRGSWLSPSFALFGPPVFAVRAVLTCTHDLICQFLNFGNKVFLIYIPPFVDQAIITFPFVSSRITDPSKKQAI